LKVLPQACVVDKPTAAWLLGHDNARYAHLAAAPLRAADDAVGAKITAAMQINLPHVAQKRSA
jgi:hypothetical protein